MKKQYLLFSLVFMILGVFLFITNHKQENQPKTTVKNSSHGSAVKKQPNSPLKVNSRDSKILEAYVQDFRDPNVVDYSKLTHVIFSFVHPKMDGGILFGSSSALADLRTVVSKAKKYHTKVVAAVGGWSNVQGGPSYKYFKAAISNPVSRSKLANELSGLADREKLDGIDIDFEYPRSTVDSQNLTAFVKELSGLLHPKGKELSIAVYSEVNAATETESPFIKYEPSIFTFVDHVNIMAYDGQWDGKYNAANLSPYPFAEKVVNYWSRLFDANHLSKDKLVLGVPLYAQPDNPAIKQVSYGAIIHKNPANAETDTISMNGTTYHYNGEETMKMKTKLALDTGFGGMMMWEAGQDAKGSNSITATISQTMTGLTHQYTQKR